jgi:VWFA-related protein
MGNQALFKGVCMVFSLLLPLMLDAQAIAPTKSAAKVLIPVLVESTSGEVVFGLSATDFSLRDNGIEQRIRLEKHADAKPVALIVVLQTGHDATKALGQVARLPDLLDGLLTNPQDQIAIITFDGSPQVLQGFTSDQESVASALNSISKGNSRAALFDAMHMAIGYFQRAPADDQRMIFLISGEHDHGSVGSDMRAVIRDASSSDVSVYSFSFRPGGGQLFGTLRSLNPLDVAANTMGKNAGAALAELTGGEFFRFSSERDFEDRVDKVANHIQNRYTLSFEPTSPQPGFHAIQVSVRAPTGSTISARKGYWISAESAP